MLALPAASGLETGILKFVLPAAVHPVTRFILESVRYSDNIMYSFKSWKEFEEVKEDLNQSLEKYSMGLKYCISSQQFDPMVLEHPKRGPEVVEKTMGLLWNVVEDTITATPKYNLFGTARGRQLGTPLVEMSVDQVLQQEISRLTLLRLAAQTYDNLHISWGP